MKNFKIILTCKEATQLVEKSNMSQISFKERFALKFHLMICRICSAYKKQSTLLHEILTNKFSAIPTDDFIQTEVIQNDTLKERIISKF
jgi:hypothetical protein